MSALKYAKLVAIFGLIGLLFGCGTGGVNFDNQGAPASTGFFTKQFQFEGSTKNYTVFVPQNYNPGNRYPVIVFLHGVMEGGFDGRKCVTVGLGVEIQKRRGDFPFIAVFPQSGSDWVSEEHQRQAIATLDQVLKDYPAADPDRVFLTGLSNGGDGTWFIGANYANRFAAIAPMCSSVNYDDAPRLTKMPIWAFHNSVDPFRDCGRAEEMVKKISDLGGNARFTKYDEMGHDCWSRAYGEGEVFTWMLGLRRAGAAAPATNK